MCVIKDVGIVSALGIGVAETESRLFAGDMSGMRKLDNLLGGDSTYFGCVDLSAEQLALDTTRVGALLNVAMSQIKPSLEQLKAQFSASRIGAVIGTSNSTMEEFTDNPDKINMAYPAEVLRNKWGVEGPIWSVSTACSSSAKVFASARRLLEEDLCDVVIVGGADAYTRTVVEGFHALEALSQQPTKPLSAARDGINLGEGAAVFLLCREGEGVRVLGVGESSDAHHLTAPDPEGKGAESSMRAALADAGLMPKDIDYINLHGTGTTYNDSMECAAVRRVFGDAVACSSTKPMTGHCLGAAGAIEAALCYIALRRGLGMPPHVIDSVDTNIAPFTIPRVGNQNKLRTILSNSFAFGGSNASLILGF